MIDKYIEEKSSRINHRLKELVSLKNSSYQNKLYEAADYSLHSGGKRLRPILLLATVDTFGIKSKAALDVGCAIEMVHTYSLIHDDLPCMDDDDMRRNKPSLHKAYNEWLALLTGDYLLTYAFEVIAKSRQLSDSQIVKIVSTLSERIGGEGLIAGQYVDLSSSNEETDWEKLKFMHLNKTASLFSACFECGAIIAKAKKADLNALQSFGLNLGFAFQILDDISDASLEKKDKKTAVSILGINEAKKKAEELYKQALLSLNDLSKQTDLLKDLASKLIKEPC